MLDRLKKIFVSFVAAITFGTFVPFSSQAATDRTSKSHSMVDSHEMPTKIEVKRESDKEEAPRDEADTKKTSEQTAVSWQEIAQSDADADELRKQFSLHTIREANKYGFKKFGPVISEKIGGKYQAEIVPKMVQAIDGITANLDRDSLRHLDIFNEPAPGSGERLFHVMNTESNRELVRFHVRRDSPPQEGYWFNFHYHLPQDQFQAHYDLGKIYWHKNMPPQWQA